MEGTADKVERVYRSIDHLGNLYESDMEMCEAWKVSEVEYHYRLSKGWSVEKSLVTCGRAKVSRDHLGSIYGTQLEMCTHYNISNTTYLGRIRRGWNLEKALTTPANVRNRGKNDSIVKGISLRGKSKSKENKDVVKDHLGNEYATKTEMCKQYNIALGVFNYRVAKGGSLEDCLTGEAYEGRIRKDHLGRVYSSQTEMCDAYDIPRSRFKERINYGWSIKDALTRGICDGSDMISKKFTSVDGLVGVVVEKEKVGVYKVQYEDGTIHSYSRLQRNLREGIGIHHPRGIKFIKNRTFGSIKVVEEGYYSKNQKVFYYIGECEKCGLRKVMSIDEMERHTCEEQEEKVMTYGGKVCRVGEVSVSNRGEKMTVKDARHNKDIDIEFEDGTIAYNRRFDNFCKGNVSKRPHINNRSQLEIYREERVGVIEVNKDGYEMECVWYGRSSDIVVKFDNDEKVRTTWSCFKSGSIRRPEIGEGSTWVYEDEFGDDYEDDVVDEFGDDYEDGSVNEYKDSDDDLAEFWENCLNTKLEKGYSVDEDEVNDCTSDSSDSVEVYDGSCADLIDLFSSDKNGSKDEVVEVYDTNSYVDSFNSAMRLVLGISDTEDDAHNLDKDDKIIGRQFVSMEGVTGTVVGVEGKQYLVSYEDGTVYSYKKLVKKMDSGTVKHPRRPSKMVDNAVGTMRLTGGGCYIKEHKTFYYSCECSKCGCIGVKSIDEMKNHDC